MAADKPRWTEPPLGGGRRAAVRVGQCKFQAVPNASATRGWGVAHERNAAQSGTRPALRSAAAGCCAPSPPAIRQRHASARTTVQ